MDITSSNFVAIGPIKEMKTLCTSCVYQGCTNCPSNIAGREESIDNYPQIIKAEQNNLRVFVKECKNYSEKRKQKEKTKVMGKKELFRFNPKTRKFEKVKTK